MLHMATVINITLVILWIAFGAYWLVSALRAKPASRQGHNISEKIVAFSIVTIGVLIWRAVLLHIDTSAYDPGVLGRIVGVALVLAGLGLAVWARVMLGSNWGVPMSRKQNADLITTGPYRLVRHPIYSGIILALIGTAIATTLAWLGSAVIIGMYFTYSSYREEHYLAAQFPKTYSPYRRYSKMFIPYLW